MAPAKLQSPTKYSTSLSDQLNRVWLTLVSCFIFGLSVVIALYTLTKITGTPLSQLTRDPVTITNASFYIGVMSNLGILLWSATTGICLLVAVFVSGADNQREVTLFFCWSGLLTALLTFDDTFLLHEELFPKVLSIPEFGVFVGYVGVFLAYLSYFARRVIFMSDYLLLLLAILFLGCSAVMDQFLSFGELETFFEDSIKFFGIVLWLAYFAHTSMKIMRGILNGHKVSRRSPDAV